MECALKYPLISPNMERVHVGSQSIISSGEVWVVDSTRISFLRHIRQNGSYYGLRSVLSTPLELLLVWSSDVIWGLC